MAQLKEDMSAGKITVEMLEEAFRTATSEGGKYNGMMEQMSKTMGGAFSNLEGAMQKLYNALGMQIEGTVVEGTEAATVAINKLSDAIEEAGDILGSIVVAFGSYKAACMLAVISTKAVQMAELEAALAGRTLTGAQMALAVAHKSGAIAAKRFAAALNLNWVTLAATAVAALAVGVYKLATADDAATSAQKSWNEQIQKARQDQEELNSAIDNAISALKNNTATEEEHSKAIKLLHREYGSIIQDYIDEKGHLKDIIKLEEKIISLRGQRRLDDAKGLVDDYKLAQDYLNKLSGKGGKGKAVVGDMKSIQAYYSGEKAETIQRIIKQFQDQAGLGKNTRADFATFLQQRIKASARNLTTTKVDQYAEDLGKQGDAQLRKLQSQLEAAQTAVKGHKATYVAALKDYLQATDISELQTRVNGILESRDKSGNKSPKQFVNEAKKAAESATKALNNFVNSSTPMSKAEFDAEVKRLKDEKEAAEKAYKEATGGTDSMSKKHTPSDLAKQTATYKKAIEDYNREIERLKTDWAYQSEQNVIDTMREGSAKERKQRDLDHRMAVEQIKRNAEDEKNKLIDAAEQVFEQQPDNKKGKRAFDREGFRNSAEYQDAAKTIEQNATGAIAAADAQYAIFREEQARLDVAAMNEYLKEWGNAQERRAAIEAEWNAKIREAREKGESEYAIKGYEKQKERDLSNSTLEALKQTPEYIRAFEDLGDVSNETLTDLIVMFEKAKDAAGKSLNPDELKAYTDAIKSMRDELEARDPFVAMATAISEASKAQSELNAAQIEANTAIANVTQAQEDYDNSVRDFGKYSPEATIAQRAYTTAVAANAQAQEKVRKASDKVRRTDNKVIRTKKQAANEVDKLASAINSLGSAMGGEAGKVLNLIGNVAQFASVAMKGVETTAATTSKAMKAVQNAVFIIQMIAMAYEVLNQLVDLLGLVDDGKAYERAKDRYDTLKQTWKELIDLKKEYLETSWGGEISSIEDDTERLYKLSQEAARTMGKKRRFVWDWMFGKGTMEGLSQLTSVLGMDEAAKIQLGETSLFDMSVEQLQKLKEEAPLFWSEMDDDARQYLQDIIDGEKELDKFHDSVKEKWTQMSFNELRSNFVDTLMDMEADASDFADDMSEKMMRAMLEQRVGIAYDKWLEGWYDRWAKAMEADDAAERANLQREWNDKAQEAIEMRNQLAESVGYTGGNYREATSTVNAVQSVSEDTANELVGRMTAMQLIVERDAVAGEGMVNQMVAAIEQLSDISTKSGESQAILDAILSQHALTNTYLEEVVKLAKLTQGAVGDISSDIKDISNKL